MHTTPIAAPVCTPQPSLLNAAFAVFSTLRVTAYLPTIWAIVASADSTQHSLFTWAVFAGANATLAARIYAEQGRRLGPCVVVPAANAAMCLVVAAVIGWFRA